MLKIKHFFLACLMLCSVAHLNCFNNLDDVKKYTQTHEEYPLPNNDNLLIPDYSDFYKAHVPRWYNKVTNFFGITKKELWNADDFFQVLQKITTMRKDNAYFDRFVEKMIPKANSKFVILAIFMVLSILWQEI